MIICGVLSFRSGLLMGLRFFIKSQTAQEEMKQERIRLLHGTHLSNNHRRLPQKETEESEEEERGFTEKQRRVKGDNTRA